MLLSLILSLTCTFFHIHARLLPSSYLASADSSNSKAITRDLDAAAQYSGVTCSAQSSLNKRGVIPRDSSIYGSSTTDNSLIASSIQDNAIDLLALNTPLQTQNIFPVSGSQPVNSENENPPNNEPFNSNNLFDGQDTIQAMGILPENEFLKNAPVDLSAPTENIALENLDVNKPGGSPDPIDNNGLVAIVQNPDTGTPTFPHPEECFVTPPENMYTVWEIIYQGETHISNKWPHAILVTNGFESTRPFIKYVIVRVGGTKNLQLGVVPNYVFLDKKGVVRLSNAIRRGWLVVPEGIDRTVALVQFRQIADLKIDPAYPGQSVPHWQPLNEHITATWARYVFATLGETPSPSPFWIKDSDPTP